MSTSPDSGYTPALMGGRELRIKQNIQNKKEDTHQSLLAARMSGLGARFPQPVHVRGRQPGTEIKPCDAVTSPPHRTTIIISPVAAMAVHTRGAENVFKPFIPVLEY